MAKKTGLGATVTVDTSGGTPTDISGDCRSFSFSTPRGVIDVTGVDKSAFERLLALADFQVTLNGVFNTALSHTVWSTVGTQAGTVLRTVSLVFNAGGTISAECVPTDYSVNRGEDGSLMWSVPLQLANGTAAAWS